MHMCENDLGMQMWPYEWGFSYANYQLGLINSSGKRDRYNIPLAQ